MSVKYIFEAYSENFLGIHEISLRYTKEMLGICANIRTNKSDLLSKVSCVNIFINICYIVYYRNIE